MQISNIHESIIVNCYKYATCEYYFLKVTLDLIYYINKCMFRSMCFAGSKTTQLRLMDLNPIKHSCSFFKHYLIYSIVDKCFFPDQQEVLYHSQHGFWEKKYSTKHALIDVVNQIQCNFKKVMFTCGIFIDLEKAFEMVDHNVLLEELQYVIME